MLTARQNADWPSTEQGGIWTHAGIGTLLLPLCGALRLTQLFAKLILARTHQPIRIVRQPPLRPTPNNLDYDLCAVSVQSLSLVE